MYLLLIRKYIVNIKKYIFLTVLLMTACRGAYAASYPVISNIDVKVAPVGGVTLSWDSLATSAPKFYRIETRTSGSSWGKLSGSELNDTGDRVIVKIPINSVQNGIQYRAKACIVLAGFKSLCSKNWSSVTTPVNVSSYNRDTSDRNSNGIRDDVEALADFYQPQRSDNHTYLLHYAFYLQKLVDSSYGPSMEMYNDFRNLSTAQICAKNAEGITEIKSTILDNQNAMKRYYTATDSFTSNSFWGVTTGASTCLIDINALSSSNYKSYEVSELEKITHLNQVSKTLITPRNSTNSSNIKKNLVYINGMLTNKELADQNYIHIREVLNEFGATNISLSLAHNFSGGLMVDLTQVIKQYVSSPNDNEGWFKAMLTLTNFTLGRLSDSALSSIITNYIAGIDFSDYRSDDDMRLIRNHVYSKIQTGDTILLAHSQGNFYANEIWEEVNVLNTPNTADFLRIHGLGTPASYIPRNFYYYTNYDDFVINTIRTIGHVEPLPWNINLGTSGDLSGHSLTATYLKKGAYNTNKVVERLLTYFDEMKSEVIEEEHSGTCQNISSSGGGNTSYSFSPYIGSFKGTLKFYRNSFSARNAFRILDRFNNTLISTSLESDSHITNFYYDSSIHGKLNIRVTAENSSNDAWELEIICPS
jgi:hypothetical protein